MKNIFFLLSVIFIFSFSCETTSPDDLDKNEIIEILDSIQSNFNFDDLDGIMQYYHQLFLHNGDDHDWERTIWEIRISEYNNLIIEDSEENPIEVALNGNFATAHFLMYLDETITDEPSDENGDISYFYYEYGSWKLCGKDFSYEP